MKYTAAGGATGWPPPFSFFILFYFPGISTVPSTGRVPPPRIFSFGSGRVARPPCGPGPWAIFPRPRLCVRFLPYVAWTKLWPLGYFLMDEIHALLGRPFLYLAGCVVRQNRAGATSRRLKHRSPSNDYQIRPPSARAAPGPPRPPPKIFKKFPQLQVPSRALPPCPIVVCVDRPPIVKRIWRSCPP